MKKNQIIEYAAYGVGAYFLFTYIKNKIGTSTIGPSGGGGVPTTGQWSMSEAKKIADRLDYAMGDFGTKEQMMFDALTPLTGPQLVDVYNAFGLRNYIAWGYVFGAGAPLDLFGHFDEELAGSDLQEMKSLWQKSGLTWAFS